VFFFTLYSLGLRLGDGLALTVGDIDGERMRVHVRDAKGNRDRLVPLPEQTLHVLRGTGACTSTRGCCFPTVPAACAAACSARCTKWRRAAG
jgi:integrase